MIVGVTLESVNEFSDRWSVTWSITGRYRCNVQHLITLNGFIMFLITVSYIYCEKKYMLCYIINVMSSTGCSCKCCRVRGVTAWNRGHLACDFGLGLRIVTALICTDKSKNKWYMVIYSFNDPFKLQFCLSHSLSMCSTFPITPLTHWDVKCSTSRATAIEKKYLFWFILTLQPRGCQLMWPRALQTTSECGHIDLYLALTLDQSGWMTILSLNGVKDIISKMKSFSSGTCSLVS